MDKLDKPIQVTKCFLPPFEEYVNMIKQIWESSWVTNNGPLHNELENKMCKYLKVDNSSLFTNGHLALDIAIKSLELNGEVITTPFTFASTTHAIVMNNLTPVFCDINLDDFTVDTDKIESLITEKTSAIIPVHVFGYPCNIQKINEIAKKYNLKVIYDAAHAFGVEIDGAGIGTFGDISMFSLHATKVYNSIEGGLLTYNNNNFKKIFNMLKNFGITGLEDVEAIGLNAKMNEFQAAMGLVNLRYIDDQINKRKVISKIYRDELKDIDGLYYLNDKDNVKHNYSYFPIVIDSNICKINRDELYEILKKHSVFARKYFYPLITNFNCYSNVYKDNDLNNSKFVANGVLTLPIYGELTSEEVYKITKIIRAVLIV